MSRTLRFAVLLVVAGVFLPIHAAADTIRWPRTEGSVSSPPRTSEHPQAFVVRRDGDVIAGRLASLQGDTLWVHSAEERFAVGAAELARVIVLPEESRWKGALWGAALTMYIMAFAYRADGQPVAFYSSEKDDMNFLGTALLNLAFGTVGGLFGWLAGSGPRESRETVFGGEAWRSPGAPALHERTRMRLREDVQQSQAAELAGDTTRARSAESAPGDTMVSGLSAMEPAEFVRLVRFVEKWNASRRFRLSIQWAYIDRHTMAAAEDLWRSAGFGLYHYSGGQDAERTDPVNLVRRMEASVAVSGGWHAALAKVSVSEPLLFGYLAGWSLEQSHRGTGWFAIAKYTRILSGTPRGGTRLVLGAGIGKAQVESELVAKHYESGSWTTIRRRIDERPICGYASAGIEFLLTRGISLGVVADYILGPSYDLEAIPEANLRAQEVHVGQAGIGMELAVHI